MSNEPLFKIFIDVFLKHQEFILWQIIDGSKWGLCSFLQINYTIIWLMFRWCVCIFLFKNIFVVLVLNNDLMLLHPKIRGWNGIHKKCISLLCCLYEYSCSHEQRLEMFGSLVTHNISFTLEFLHALISFYYVFKCRIMFKVPHAC